MQRTSGGDRGTLPPHAPVACSRGPPQSLFAPGRGANEKKSSQPAKDIFASESGHAALGGSSFAENIREQEDALSVFFV